jgi:hypothetical protein
MKYNVPRIIGLMMSVMALFCYTAMARPVFDNTNLNTLIETIQISIDNNDSKQIEELLDKTIEITILNNQNTLSSNQALMQLSNFYAKYRPLSFKVDYKSNVDSRNLQYVIGTAVSKKGSFKMYFFIKYKLSKWVIQEIRITNT